MAISERKVYNALLNGHFIRPRYNISKIYSYCLYNKELSPVALISDTLFLKIAPIMKRKKQEFVFTLNLNEVRKLSGHHTVKKMYKDLKSKTNDTRRITKKV